ncbi:MAG: D-Ala-D-Ala dipeptidase [Rhodospirillales bacterium]|nr:D-Ala-D-Ala dipeptidase [Rhodospirillales bacterium]MCB9997161.1 D-Ala-D-Ala dipeptidase [Rhodospirillales bacterium]
MTQKQITPDALVPMDIYGDSHKIRIDLVYADAAHPENIFKTDIYRQQARLWLHKEFAAIVVRAAEIMGERWGGIFVLKDGLRTTDAQQAMQETAIVKANPQWLADGPSRLLSPPGRGGHPRGMAVDVTVEDADGTPWDMGTSFDHLTTDPADNPAARDYMSLPAHVLENRRRLEQAFNDAAQELGLPLLPLPAEWWDFRFPASYSDAYAPLSDQDLPPDMRMT